MKKTQTKFVFRSIQISVHFCRENSTSLSLLLQYTTHAIRLVTNVQ